MGGENTLNNHWRVHCYVRMIALDGNFIDKSMYHDHQQYKEVVRESVLSGNRPSHFSTMNSTGGSGSDTEVKDYQHNPPKFSELGTKLFGLEDYE